MGAMQRIVVAGLALVCALYPVASRAQVSGEERRNIEVPFLWTPQEANEACTKAAASVNGRWTGDWRIAVPGKSSYCVVTDIRPTTKAPQPKRTRDVSAGPIWSQADAEMKCRLLAEEARGEWTGQWRTTEPGKNSVCEIAIGAPSDARDVEAGPIWNQADAAIKCPVAAAAVRGVWTGQWTTIREGQMSVCQIGDITPRTVEAGPIWNQNDANLKCPVAAAAVSARWTGVWRTTRQGEMSVCEVVD